MPFGDVGGSIGRAIGASVGKAVKPKTVGKTVGKSVAKTSRGTSKRRSVSGGSRNTSRGSGGGGSRGYGGGGGNRGGGGGGGGSATPSIPGINAYLGTDSIYQDAVRGGNRTLADFLSELTRRRGEATTQFNQTKGGMERDRVTQLEALRDEFASRGLIQSGLYGEEQGRFQQQFTEQMQALEQQQAALIADLLGQEKNYRRENDLALEAAKQDALARRSAKYRIGA